MPNATTYILPLEALWLQLYRLATATTESLMADLSTPFSISVYNSGFFSLDDLIVLRQRFVEAKDGEEFILTGDELLTLYSCHYVANCFAQNKEAFFKWFIAEDDGNVDNSNTFRITVLDFQAVAADIIEDNFSQLESLPERKQALLDCFGPMEKRK